MSNSGRVEVAGDGQQRALVVGLRVSIRITEVALGVVRVVQTPLGDGSTGNGSVEDVGPSQHGEGGEVPAERPAANAPPWTGRT